MNSAVGQCVKRVRQVQECHFSAAQGQAEAEKCAWVCRYYADEAAVILADEPIEAGRTKSYVAYRPLGVVLAVMP